jgi:putative transposase
MEVVTKYRRKCITAPMLTRLREITEQRCRDWRGTLVEFNGESDHIHIFMSLPPDLDSTLSRFVNNLKTTSSRLIRRDFSDHLKRVSRKPVFWSRSYCIISCGGSSNITSNSRKVRLEPGRLSPPAKRKRSGWSARRRSGSDDAGYVCRLWWWAV